jgi:hypothetical protein
MASKAYLIAQVQQIGGLFVVAHAGIYSSDNLSCYAYGMPMTLEHSRGSDYSDAKDKLIEKCMAHPSYAPLLKEFGIGKWMTFNEASAESSAAFDRQNGRERLINAVKAMVGV